MKCYLAGPMRGIPDLNFRAFAEGAKILRQQGYEVFNPAAANLEKWSLREIFAYELDWICREAQAVAFLPGWENSKGARAEHATAEAIGLDLIYL